MYPEVCNDHTRVNVDATSPLDYFGAAVASDKQERWLGFAYKQGRWRPPLEAEMEAVLLGLKLVKQVKMNHLIILSDSLQEVKVLNGNFISYPWQLRNVFLDCKH